VELLQGHSSATAQLPMSKVSNAIEKVVRQAALPSELLRRRGVTVSLCHYFDKIMGD